MVGGLCKGDCSGGTDCMQRGPVMARTFLLEFSDFSAHGELLQLTIAYLALLM